MQLVIALIVGAGCLTLPSFVVAAEQSAQTSFGLEQSSVPDFSGIWARTNVVTFFPVPGDDLGQPVERLSLEGVDAPEIMAGNYDNPILQPWAREIVKKNAESEINLQHVYTSDGACWPSGVPQIINLREPVQILQEEDAITVLYQRDHQMRRISLNREHSPNPAPSWYGESVGHYEGDVLVVDTTYQRTHRMSVVDNYGTPHTDKIHVVERYRLVDDQRGQSIEVRFRVDDPGAFTMPWAGMAVYRPSSNGFEEVICAENNRSFETGSVFGVIPEETEPAF